MSLAENTMQNRIVPTAILFLLFVSRSFSGLPGDTLRKVQSYDINDPRNPDCPCHKYQKLADEEYAKLTGKNQEEEGISAFSEQKEKTSDAHTTNGGSEYAVNFKESGSHKKNDKINKHSRDYFFKSKHTLKRKKHDQLRIPHVTVHSRIFHRSSEIDSCFRWK
jgi:hypothetical protein